MNNKLTIYCIIFIMLAFSKIHAQSTDTIIYLSIINDTALISISDNNDGTLSPVFTSSSINSILANYKFKVFQKAFPYTRYLYLKQVYKVIANETSFAGVLKNTDSTIFAHYEIRGPALNNGITYPNDFCDLHECTRSDGFVFTWYLDYINAPGAWFTTKGSNHTIIGITDPTGFFLNWNNGTSLESNPDLYPNVSILEDNSVFPIPSIPGNEPDHGTLVSGLASCGTDNSIGYSSIGWNCLLDLSDYATDEEMQRLAIYRGDRILNGSWWSGMESCDNFDYSDEIITQGIYDEIYENGTTVCFAAGNDANSGSLPLLG